MAIELVDFPMGTWWFSSSLCKRLPGRVYLSDGFWSVYHRVPAFFPGRLHNSSQLFRLSSTVTAWCHQMRWQQVSWTLRISSSSLGKFHHDLTVLPHWEWWLVRVTIPKWPQVSGQWNINKYHNLPRSSVISSFTIYPLPYLHHMDCTWIVYGLKDRYCKGWMGPAWSHHQCPVNAVDIPILSLSFSDCIHHITQQGHSLSLYVYYIYLCIYIYIYIFIYLYVYIYIYIYLFIYIYISIYLFIHVFIYLLMFIHFYLFYM